MPNGSVLWTPCAAAYVRRASFFAAALVGLTLFAGQVRAQNLVPDPQFVNGLKDYNYEDSSFSPPYTDPSITTFQGHTVAYLPTLHSFIKVYPIATTPGVDYIFTFLAAAVDPTAATALFATFEPTEQGNSNTGVGTLYLQSFINPNLTKITVTGTAKTTMAHVYVEAADQGGLYVTDFNFEPASPQGAPVPVIGGGAISMLVSVAGVAFAKYRRRTVGGR